MVFEVPEELPPETRSSAHAQSPAQSPRIASGLAQGRFEAGKEVRIIGMTGFYPCKRRKATSRSPRTVSDQDIGSVVLAAWTWSPTYLPHPPEGFPWKVRPLKTFNTAGSDPGMIRVYPPSR